MASDIISQIGKGKRQSVTQALADTGMFRVPTIAGDEDSGLFNVSAIKEWDAKNRTQTIIPGDESTPSQQVASDPLAAIKAKDAAITNSRTVPTIAGLTPDMVQRPMQSSAMPVNGTTTVPAIAGRQLTAGVKQFDFNSKQPASGVVANNSRSDWSPGSVNAVAASGNLDDQGRTYDEQVAFAKQFNSPSAQIQRLATQIPYQKGNQFDGAEKIAGINAQIAGLQQQAGLETDQYKSDKASESHKYTADQALAGHKLTADATVKAHELTAIGNVEKAKIDGQEKQREKQHEAYLKDENEMKSLLRDKYGVDPNVGLPAYKQHLQNLQLWDKQITKQLDLLKSGKAGYTPEQGTFIENALKAYHQNPQDKNALALLEEARKTVTGGGNAQEPSWWRSAVSMPRFDYLKVPQLPTSKAVIAGA